MNTHRHLKTYLVFAFLIGFTSLFSQHTNPQIKVVSNHAAENFSDKQEYNIENEGLIASDFAKTRIVATTREAKVERNI